MENYEDFWLQVSTNGGATYSTVSSWERGADFDNNTRYFESVTLTGPFSNATRLRFRCDASSNLDRIYLDDVLITGCNNGSGNSRIITEADVVEQVETEVAISIGALYPNPATNVLNVKFLSAMEKEANVQLYDLTGKLMQSKTMNLIPGKQIESFDVSTFGNGIYFLHLTTDKQHLVKKFVVTK